MMQNTVATDRMQRPLEGNGLIGTRALVQRDGRHHRLEVEVASRRPEVLQQEAEIGREVRCSAYYRISDDGLPR